MITSEKTKISAFEFAIMQIADKEESERYEPYTKEEETKIRIDKLINSAEKIKIKKCEV